MKDWSSLYLFIITATVLVFFPGPNTLYIITRSVEQGRVAGIVSSLGVQLASLIHIAVAALGLSALIVTSSLAFGIVKYAGATCLIFLGIKTLSTRKTNPQPEQMIRTSLRRVFYQGAVVNLLNPKTIIFFFTFLPQFVDTSVGSIPKQIVFLGAILVFLGFVSDSIYALTAGSIGGLLRGDSRFLHAQPYVAGSVYIGLGIVMAISNTS